MTGAELIAAERQRQIDSEGWTPEHDDEHLNGELANAGATYADAATIDIPLTEQTIMEMGWPWEFKWFKPASPIRMLVKAGALIAAEIDRRLRRGETL